MILELFCIEIGLITVLTWVLMSEKLILMEYDNKTLPNFLKAIKLGRKTCF